MRKLDKQLRRFSPKERKVIEILVERIILKDFQGLNVKKLKGLRNIFRVRKGDIRIIFKLNDVKESHILAIERRSEKTYK